MKIRPGLMRSVITIQEQSATKNSFNQQVNTWTDLHTDIRARKILKKGDEKKEGSGDIAARSTTFKIRYIRGLTTDHRIVEGANVYDILYIDNVGERCRELDIECENVSRKSTTGR